MESSLENEAATSPPLVRPVEGRMVAGVAKGIADHLGVPLWLVRVAFVVTAFMGGLGLALYAAGWGFIRSQDEPTSPAERVFSRSQGPRSWLGLALIALGAVAILDLFTVLDGQVVWATALLVVGLLLYLGYIEPGRRPPSAGPDPKEGVQAVTTSEDTGDSLLGADLPPVAAPSPPPPTPPDIPPAKERSMLGRLTIGVILLGMGALAVLDNIDSVPIDAGPRHYLALAVTILGLGLVVGSVLGRARWLIVVGAVMIPTLIFSPVFEYDWNETGVVGFVMPSDFDQLDTSYHREMGSLVIDLTGLDWDGQTVELALAVEVGTIEVRVPEGVAIEGQARAELGRVSGPDGESFGIGDASIGLEHPGDRGLVVIDAQVDAGVIEIFVH